MKKLLSSISLLLGISIPILSINNIHNVEAEANKMLYIDLSLNDKFLEDEAHPYLEYNDGELHNINLLLIDNDIYQLENNIPLDILDNEEYGFRLCAYNGEYHSIYINKDILEDIRYNYICLDEYIIDEDSNILGYGYYGDKIINPGATYKTQRIWLNNDNEEFYDVDDWSSESKNAIGYINQDKYNIIVMESIINIYDSSQYFYADIPYNITSIDFLRLSNNDNHNYLIYQNNHINNLTYGICYHMNINDYSNISISPVSKATASMLGLVVEAYLTYGKDASNGSVEATVRNLYNTWFSDKSASKDELKDTKIKDYTSYSQETGYEGATKEAWYSVNEKWNTMCSMAGIDPNTGEARGLSLSFLNNSTMLMIITVLITGLIVTAGIVVFKIIKKKREI